MGRRPIGKHAMTAAERQRRLRARLRAEQPDTPEAMSRRIKGELTALRRLKVGITDRTPRKKLVDLLWSILGPRRVRGLANALLDRWNAHAQDEGGKVTLLGTTAWKRRVPPPDRVKLPKPDLS
jgi:hypothetical protein